MRFFQLVRPCSVGAIPCCLAVVTAADRAAATFQRLGTIPVNAWEPEGVAGAIGKLPDGLRPPPRLRRGEISRVRRRAPSPQNANRRGSRKHRAKTQFYQEPSHPLSGRGPGGGAFLRKAASPGVSHPLALTPGHRGGGDDECLRDGVREPCFHTPCRCESG